MLANKTIWEDILFKPHPFVVEIFVDKKASAKENFIKH